MNLPSCRRLSAALGATRMHLGLWALNPLHCRSDSRNHFLVYHVLTRTKICQPCLLSPLVDVFRQFRVLPEEPFFQWLTADHLGISFQSKPHNFSRVSNWVNVTDVNAPKQQDRKRIRIPRVAIVGAGFVGSTTAYALLNSGVAAEIVLIDRDRRRAEGHVQDLRDAEAFSHAMPKPTRPFRISAT
jgi:lactate/malate dehydrogenase family protein